VNYACSGFIIPYTQSLDAAVAAGINDHAVVAQYLCRIILERVMCESPDYDWTGETALLTVECRICC